MNNRIKQLRNELKLSGEEFGKRLGVGRSIVSQYETGSKNVPERTINTICKVYGVNKEWLISGIGDMFLDENEDELHRLVANITMGYDDTAKAFLQAWIGLSDKDKKSVEKFIKEVAKGIK